MSRLDALLFTRRVVAQNAERELAQLDEWIDAEVRRDAARAHAAEHRPAPEWLVERGLDKSDAIYVHVGHCWSAAQSTRTQAITRDQALQALRRIPACPHCRPDTELGVLD